MKTIVHVTVVHLRQGNTYSRSACDEILDQEKTKFAEHPASEITCPQCRKIAERQFLEEFGDYDVSLM